MKRFLVSFCGNGRNYLDNVGKSKQNETLSSLKRRTRRLDYQINMIFLCAKYFTQIRLRLNTLEGYLKNII